MRKLRRAYADKDYEQLLDMVPKPVKAIIMVFPLTEKLEELRQDEDGRIAKDGQHKLDPGVIFIKQTVTET